MAMYIVINKTRKEEETFVNWGTAQEYLDECWWWEDVRVFSTYKLPTNVKPVNLDKEAGLYRFFVYNNVDEHGVNDNGVFTPILVDRVDTTHGYPLPVNIYNDNLVEVNLDQNNPTLAKIRAMGAIKKLHQRGKRIY